MRRIRCAVHKRCEATENGAFIKKKIRKRDMITGTRPEWNGKAESKANYKSTSTP